MSTFAIPSPPTKRPRSGSLALQQLQPPLKRPQRVPVNKNRRTYTSFPQFVSQVIGLALKNEYSYCALTKPDEIRLLVVNPSSNLDDAIYCELVSTADRPALADEYEALSYTWGDDDPIHEIKIHSFKPGQKRSLKQSVWAKFFVRSNLQAALRYLRDPVRPVVLWVDAICINQNDKTEKNWQVSRMADIYNRASNVCIWLGVGDLKSKMALEFVPTMLEGSNFDDLVEDETTCGHWHALALLMRNRWFSRRWVVQELALARDATLHCGHDQIIWEDFSVAVALFVERFDQINDMVRNSRQFGSDPDPLGSVRAYGANIIVGATNNLFRKSNEGEIVERLSSLEVLVSTLLTFDATDPRDTVYAVLSIAKDTSGAAVQASISSSSSKLRPPAADYQKSLREVCKDFVAYCVDSSGSLDIICRHWAPVVKKRQQSLHEKLRAVRPPAKEQLPTWIPSVAKSPFGTPEDALNGRVNGDSFVGSPNQKNYDAAPGTVARVRFGETTEDDEYRGPHPSANTPTDRVYVTDYTTAGEATSEGSTPQARRPSSSMSSPTTQSFAQHLAFAQRTSPVPLTLQLPQFTHGSSGLLSAFTSPIAETFTSASAAVPPNPNHPDINNSHMDFESDGSFFSDPPITNATALPPSTNHHVGEGPHNTNGTNGTLPKKMKSDGTMFVKGFRLDVVSSLGSRIAEGLIPRECFEMGGWAQTDNESNDIPKVPDELWRTLVADRGADGKNPPPWYHRACQHVLAQSSTTGDINIQKLIETGRPAMMVDFLRRVQCVIWNRKFLRSAGRAFGNAGENEKQRTLFGLAPERAKVHDIICIFLGCSVPVILREHRTPIDHYFEFIGESYIYGMMDGEALGERRMEELEEMCEEFKLR